jgi:YD repeat-containing protein
MNQRAGVATSSGAFTSASSVAWRSLGYGALEQVDGENVLISTAVNSGTPPVYTYDAYHRRVGKRTRATDVTYTVYDAWNPVAEYSFLNSSFSLLNLFTWGKDLSGSIQGAGGVGGLLAVQKFTGTTGTYFPTYDGNGNISEYISTAGTIVAHYEYGPFGEQTVASGSQAADFKHRFSTKPLEGVTC